MSCNHNPQEVPKFTEIIDADVLELFEEKVKSMDYTLEEKEEMEETNESEVVGADEDYKKQKYVTLFKSRTILAKIGTMEERRVCGKLLKRMKKEGIESI